MRWTHWLLLWRTHSWPHRDGVGPVIVEGGPRRGAPAIVAGAIRAVVLPFLLPLSLTLALPSLLGLGAGGGGAA
jgi:hypothetical protein